jgi:hypothetical protein
MDSDLVANAITASDHTPFAITRCRGDSKAGTGASRSIATANAVGLPVAITVAITVALPNATTNAATDLWRAG